MAEKRMISKVISISKKFNIKLDDHFSRLLYLMIIPHSDDFGRLSGDPHDIKALVLPMMEDTNREMVEKALTKLHNVELINWYKIGSDMFIQIINFDDHQQGLHKRTRSKFPEAPEHSRKFPEIPSEGKGTEEKRTEEKGIEKNGSEEDRAHDIDSQKDRLRDLCNRMKIQSFGTYQLDIVYSYIGIAEIEVIEAAIKKSENKPHTYLTNTLHGMINVDKTLRADQLPGAKAGDNSGGSQESIRQGGSTFDDKPITGGKSGVLPSSRFKFDENGDLQVSGM